MPAGSAEDREQAAYVDDETGESYEVKPEYLTCLAGRRLALKTHNRIRFRGVIDSLEADVIEAQALASRMGEEWYTERLGEVLNCLRNILAAEVKETPLPELSLFGLSVEELHTQSHNVQKTFGIAHPVPDYTMGPLAVRLNTLRTRVREGELCAVGAFWVNGADGVSGGRCSREDIIRALNRLSSAVYWLFCRYLSAPGGKPTP
jgi:ethanolamine utilization cobalamin adenosyltransferase